MKNAILAHLIATYPTAKVEEKERGCTVVSGTTGNVYWVASGITNVTVMGAVNRIDPDKCQGTTMIISTQEADDLIKSLEV